MAITDRTIDFEKLKKPNEKKLFPGDDTYGVIGIPDIPSLQTLDMQTKFDELSKDLIIPEYNALVDDIKSDYVSKALMNETIEKIGAGDMREIDFVLEGATRQVVSSKISDNGLKLYTYNRTEARFSLEDDIATTKTLLLNPDDANGFNDDFYVGDQKYFAQKDNAKPLEDRYLKSGYIALATANPNVNVLTFFSGDVKQALYGFTSPSTHLVKNVPTSGVFYAKIEPVSTFEVGQNFKIEGISSAFTVYNPDGQLLTTNASLNEMGKTYFSETVKLVLKVDIGNKAINIVLKNPPATSALTRTKGRVDLDGFGDNVKFIPVEDFNSDDEIFVNGIKSTTINCGGENKEFGYLKDNVVVMLKKEYTTFEEETEVIRAYLYPLGEGYDDVPDGKLVMPVDDHTIWLRCAGIRQKFTLNEIIETEAILRQLIDSENAMNYMFRSLSVIQHSVLNSSLARSLLDASIPRTNPNMISASSPAGKVISGSYLAFDSATTSGPVSRGAIEAVYQFTDPIWIYRFAATFGVVKYGVYGKVMGSVDGSNWKILFETGNMVGTGIDYVPVSFSRYLTTPSDPIKYIKIWGTGDNSAAGVGLYNLRVYGK